MADASLDKAKDKPKKKKTSSTKEKAGTEQPEEKSTDAPKEKKSSKKEKTKPESEDKTDTTQVAQPGKTEGSRKPSLADGSRKASVVEGSRKVSIAEPSRKPSIADNLALEEIERNEDKFKPTYVVPPAATKKDVDLLTDLDEGKLLELKEAFELFDLNHDGIIDSQDLKMTFNSLGQTDVRDEEIRSMLSEAICPLDFEAFVILLGFKTIEMDPEQILIEALSRWDYDNSGLISEERIKHDLMTWGDKFTKREVEMALEDAPVYVNGRTGAGMIDYIKFCNTLSGLRKKTRVPGPEDFMKHK